MREIVIKNLDDAAIERLERRAAINGWSLEDEIRFILTEGIERMETILAEMEAFEKKLAEYKPAPRPDLSGLLAKHAVLEKMGILGPPPEWMKTPRPDDPT